MKTALLLPFYLITLTCTAQLKGNSEKINEKTPSRFPMESGTISYQIKGDGTGEATLQFDRNGWRYIERRKLVIKRYGIESTEERITLSDGDYLHAINLDTKKGNTTQNNHWSSLLAYKDFNTSLAAIYENNQGKFISIDTLLGKPCQRWLFSSGSIKELWLWQGLPLKTVKEVPGLKYEQVATKISDHLNSQAFEIPEDIIWE